MPRAEQTADEYHQQVDHAKSSCGAAVAWSGNAVIAPRSFSDSLDCFPLFVASVPGVNGSSGRAGDAPRNRNELPITSTLLATMATAAQIGFSQPKDAKAMPPVL